MGMDGRAGLRSLSAILGALATVACSPLPAEPVSAASSRYASQPLVSEVFTGDPAAHVFNGRIYVYTSHDIDTSVVPDDMGTIFDMRDYRVLSMDRIGGPVRVHADVLDLKDVPWARRQMWAPDVAYKNGTYYLYFPPRMKLARSGSA
ncbi:MAG: hypothetical protein ABWY78_21825 [Microvirga sp.]